MVMPVINNYTRAEFIHNISISYFPELKSRNYGSFKVIRFVEQTDKYSLFEIEFIKTGYKAIYTATNIRKGQVKDPMLNTVLGVGCIGMPIREANKVKEKDPVLYCKIYAIWHTMISRCYSPLSISYSTYGEIGITVEPFLLNFKNFYYYIIAHPDFDRDKFIAGKLQLDKDILQEGVPDNKKMYARDTIKLVSPSVNAYNRPHGINANIQERRANSEFYIYEKGRKNIVIFNLSKYCRLHNDSKSRIMSRLSKHPKCDMPNGILRRPNDNEREQLLKARDYLIDLLSDGVMVEFINGKLCIDNGHHIMSRKLR